MCRTLLSSSRRASWPTTQTAHERALPLEEGLVRPTELMLPSVEGQRRRVGCCGLQQPTMGGKWRDRARARTPPHTLRPCVLILKLQRNTPVAVVPRRLNVSDSVQRELLRSSSSCLLLPFTFVAKARRATRGAYKAARARCRDDVGHCHSRPCLFGRRLGFVRA